MAYCSDVYDGDTCQLSFIPLDFTKPYRWTCRLSRIQAPEIGRLAANKETQAQGVAARDALRAEILHKVVHIDVKSMDKYGRPVVEITRRDYVNVNDVLLGAGLVSLYTD